MLAYPRFVSNRRVPNTSRLPPTTREKFGGGYSNDFKAERALIEEVNYLQQKKRNMIDENAELRAKVARIRDMVDRPNKNPIAIKHNADANKKAQEMTEMIKKKRLKVQKTQSSDMAGNISEMQHESVIYHQEVARQKIKKAELEKNFAEAEKKLSELESKVSMDVLKKQDATLRDLIAKAEDLKKRNDTIQQRLMEKDASNPASSQWVDEIDKYIASLENDIRKEEEEISSILGEIITLHNA